MANINDVTVVNVDITQPAVDSASFDNLLILGPPPASPTRPLSDVEVYSELKELTDAGYVAVGSGADPAGIAARIAFAQNPKPAQIYVSNVSSAVQTICGSSLKIITESNYISDAYNPGGAVPKPNDLPWLQMVYNRQKVSQMQVVIEKDGVVMFADDSIPTTASDNATVQVVLGTPLASGEDAMNLPADEYAGKYTVTLTATDADGRTTTISRSVEYDGVNGFTANDGITTVAPLASELTATLDTALETNGWYVVCPAGIDENLFGTLAEWTEAQIKQCAYTFLSDTDPTGTIFYRSHGWCGLIKDYDLPDDVPSANSYLHIAIVTKCLSYEAGSETWNLRELGSVYPSELSGTLNKQLRDGHSNYFTQIAGRNVTQNGQVRAGEWIDVIRGRDWLQNDMQLRLFNLLRSQPKIPYTNSGIALVETAMMASLRAAQDRGIVAENEFDADGNLIEGFAIAVPDATALSETQRASRRLEGCKFTARLAGAIHVVVVNGTLSY